MGTWAGVWIPKSSESLLRLRLIEDRNTCRYHFTTLASLLFVMLPLPVDLSWGFCLSTSAIDAVYLLFIRLQRRAFIQLTNQTQFKVLILQNVVHVTVSPPICPHRGISPESSDLTPPRPKHELTAFTNCSMCQNIQRHENTRNLAWLYSSSPEIATRVQKQASIWLGQTSTT